VRKVVDYDFYMGAYEVSRDFGPFNHRLYAHKNHPGEVRQLIGGKRCVKTQDGFSEQELSADEIKEALLIDIGLSEALVQQWASSGALEASMNAAPEGPCAPDG
jgi:hypothetical protein